MKWLDSWGVKARVSSAYYPQSNGRAEAGVKSLKRLLKGNVGPRGSLNNDDVARALLQYRNTPLRGVNRSPAELALGRPIRDALPLPRDRYRIDTGWAQHLHEREVTMTEKNAMLEVKYNEGAKLLNELKISDKVLCQNERSKKWDKSGTIIEVKKHRQYLVRMTGSGRVSLRNRRHLHVIVPSSPNTANHPSLEHHNDGSDELENGGTVNEQDNAAERDNLDQCIDVDLQGHSQPINEHVTITEEDHPQQNMADKEPRRSKIIRSAPKRFDEEY